MLLSLLSLVVTVAPALGAPAAASSAASTSKPILGDNDKMAEYYVLDCGSPYLNRYCRPTDWCATNGVHESSNYSGYCYPRCTCEYIGPGGCMCLNGISMCKLEDGTLVEVPDTDRVICT